ncbi:MAG: HD domain-containing phosphohydrolase [Armatimonadota bacterium]
MSMTNLQSSCTGPCRANCSTERMLEVSRIVNSVLHIGLGDLPIESVLTKVLDLLLSIEWLTLQSRGCVFIAEGNKLTMVAQRGLAKPIRRMCSRLQFGKCLCGRAAQAQEIQFANCLDAYHEISYSGMSEHGHYCVPIVYKKKTLGVLNLYIPVGHQRNSQEEAFLSSVADALAITIARKQVELRLQDSNESLRKAVDGTIQVLISTVEARDPYTAGHQVRVAEIACAVAKAMGLPESRIEAVRMAASVHDIGKISIPAEILSKPSAISEPESAIIRMHPEVAYNILKSIDFPWPVADIVRQHHERMDGSGYPQALKGKEILLEARIIAVADVVDAMASHRPYRSSLGMEETVRELSEHKGTTYDTEVVEACLKIFGMDRMEKLLAA